MGLLWLLAVQHLHRVAPRASRRSAFVVAFAGFQLLVVLITEGASVGHRLSTTTVAVAWSAVVTALAVAAWKSAGGGWPAPVRTGLGLLRGLSAEERVGLAAVAGVVAVLAATVVLYPPSNNDSLAYHLPRVEHWIQNRSVAHYATHYLHQIELAPLHEFNMVHLHLLFGGDRLDGFVQLLAAVVCLVAVSDAAALLGASRRAQVAAAVICATIPSGILEAASTQNNYLTAALLSVGLVVLLLWWRGGQAVAGWVGLGGSGALAVLTKGTAAPLILPLALAVTATLVVRAVARDGARPALRRTAAGIAAGSVLGLAVVGPFTLRNIELFGSPVGPLSRGLATSDVSVRGGAANVVRNVATNFKIGDGGNGPASRASRLVLPRLGDVFHRIGVDLDAPSYGFGTPDDLNPFVPGDASVSSRSEDIGANPWHVTLIAVTGVSLLTLVGLGRRDLRLPLLLAGGLAAGFFVFSATSRFQRFGVRFSLPLLVLWCPLVALILCRANRWLGRVALALLLVVGLRPLLDGFGRSLLHPTFPFATYLSPYFPLGYSTADTVRAANYEVVTEAIARSGCPRVALANLVVLEYPLWAGLRHNGWQGVIKATNVQDTYLTNPTSALEDRRFRPCASIRRVEPTYVTPDDGAVHLQSELLAVALDPVLATRTSMVVGGVRSDLDGVRLLPGGGWRFGDPDGVAKVDGTATLYVSSTKRRSVRVGFDVVNGTAPAAVEVFRGAEPAVTVEAGEDGRSVVLDVPRGLARVVFAVSGDGTHDPSGNAVAVVVTASG